MRVVVFGGTGPSGRLVVDQALKAGMEVRVLARTPEKLNERPKGLEVIQGDALNQKDVEGVIKGQDAVVSCLGVNYTFKEVRIYSEGMRNIIHGMERHGVRRLIGVTSGGTYPGRDPINPFFFEYILKPTLGRTLYADMRRMEEIVFATDLDWTILRPPRLLDKPATGRVRVEADAYALPEGSTVSRADLAAVIVEELGQPSLIQKAAAVAD